MVLMNPLQQYSARTLMVETVTTVLALAVVAVAVAVVAAAAAPIVYHRTAASIVVILVTLRDTDGCVVTRMSIGTR